MNFEKIKGKKITELSFREIIESIGVLGDTEKYIYMFYPNYATSEYASFFLIDFTNAMAEPDNKKAYEEFLRIFDKYGEYMNKEQYVLECYKKAKTGGYYLGEYTIFYDSEAVEQLPSDVLLKSRMLTRGCENELREFLIRSEVDLAEDVSLEDGQIHVVNFLDTLTPKQRTATANRVHERIKQKNRKARAKLDKIDEEIGLENVIPYLVPIDFLEVARYRDLALSMINYVYDNKVTDDDKDILYDPSKTDKEKFIKVINDNAEYIDFDELLLISSITRVQRLIEQGGALYEEICELKEYMDKVGKLLDDKEIKLVYVIRFGESEISFKDLAQNVQETLEKFLNGKVYSDEKIKKIREDILAGKASFDSISVADYENAMKFSKEELVQIFANNAKALPFLLENNFLEVEDILQIQNSFSNEGVEALYNSGLIVNENLYKLYMSGKISAENIAVLLKDEANKERLTELISTERLIELYENRDDDEIKNEWERYSKLYKVIKFDARERDERNEVSEEIIYGLEDVSEEVLYDLYNSGLVTCDKLKEFLGKDEIELYKEGVLKVSDAESLYEENGITIESLEEVLKRKEINTEQKLTEEVLYDLYHTGLVRCDSLISYTSKDAITFLITGELKPVDAKRLYDEGKITDEMLRELIQRRDIDDGKKLDLIFSTFSGESKEEEAKRISLFRLLPDVVKDLYVQDEDTKTRQNPKPSIDTDDDGGKKTDKKGKGIDPAVRWNFISSLDEEYSKKYLLDGHAIFYLPNHGTYIVEKLFDENKEPAYGAATYVIPENIYLSNEEEIVQGENINRRALTKLNKASQAKKEIHTGRWGDNIYNNLDIDNDSRCTEERREKIRKLGKDVARAFETKNAGEITE